MKKIVTVSIYNQAGVHVCDVPIEINDTNPLNGGNIVIQNETGAHLYSGSFEKKGENKYSLKTQIDFDVYIAKENT